MARPRNADAERTKHRILEAAAERFGTQGISGTSMRTVGSDAGVTFATIHHHFGNKQGLYEATVEHAFAQFDGYQEHLLGEMGQLETPAPPADELLRRAARCTFRFALDHARYSRLLLRAVLFEQDVPNRERFEKAQRDYLELASTIIGGLVGRPPTTLRVPLQGLMFLMTRMAVGSDTELEILGGDVERTRGELADYLAQVAVATLLN